MKINEYAELNIKQTNAEIDGFSLKRYVQFFKNFGKGDRKVLDVGCNIGRGGQVLKNADPNLELTGLDVVEERISRIPQGIYQRLIVSTADNIDVADNTFDDAVAGEVIEHIHPDDVPNVVKELKRVLKPGGKLLLTTPNPRAILVLLGRDMVLKDPTHISIMTPAVLKRKLRDAGFEKIRIKGSGKMSRYLPDYFPLLTVFGSYLAIARKPAR
jgi:SAM-dependent methyltransferase